MSLHALAFFAIELVGAGIVGGLSTMLLSWWWRWYDRRRLAARMRAMEERIERLRLADATDARSLDALFELPSVEPWR